ncbi:MAG: BON domain-containing protein [Candidatus Sulfotelmatobacter sp.]
MKINSLFISAYSTSLLLAIALGTGLGCTRKPDDAKISTDIQSKFNQDSGLSSKQLKVQAEDGVVTLSGGVDNDAQREAAGRQAASVAGVKTVINNLQVDNAAATAPAESAPEPTTVTKTSAGTPAEKAKPVPTKKSSKTRSSDKPNANVPSADTSMASQMSGGRQPEAAAQAPPPTDNTAAQAPPPPPSPKKLIIDQGTPVTVRLIDPIDSEKNQTGDTFHATLNAPLSSDGEEAVPAGVELTGHLVSVKSAGKFAGQSEVVLQLDSLSAGGKTYSVQTDQYKKTGSSRGKNTAEKVGGGAVLGSIIGALAGGGKGAAIGAAAGAGVGGGVQAATKGQQIKLPSETMLNFTLQAPITVMQAPPADANRPKLGDSH